jgi:hypothetical protein
MKLKYNISKLMKHVHISSFGEPSVLKIKELPLPVRLYKNS